MVSDRLETQPLETIGFLNILGQKCLKTQVFQRDCKPNHNETHCVFEVLLPDSLKTQWFQIGWKPNHLKSLGF